MTKKLLLVEDDSDLLSILSCLLTQAGYLVEEARSGAEAIEKLQQVDCGLVVTDMKMPRVGGLELIHWVQKNKPSVPYIMMTGYSDIKGPEAAKEVGAAGFLAKPFRSKALLQLIEAAISGSDPTDFNNGGFSV